MGLVIALTRNDRAEIDRRLRAMSESDPGVRINRSLVRFMDAPAGAAAEMRRLASAASHAEKGALVQWAAYYHEPELSLELLAEVAPKMATSERTVAAADARRAQTAGVQGDRAGPGVG